MLFEPLTLSGSAFSKGLMFWKHYVCCFVAYHHSRHPSDDTDMLCFRSYPLISGRYWIIYICLDDEDSHMQNKLLTVWSWPCIVGISALALLYFYWKTSKDYYLYRHLKGFQHCHGERGILYCYLFYGKEWCNLLSVHCNLVIWRAFSLSK